MNKTYDALHDKDPAPACLARQAIHLHQTIGQDSSECACETTDDVESTISFTDIVWTG